MNKLLLLSIISLFLVQKNNKIDGQISTNNLNNLIVYQNDSKLKKDADLAINKFENAMANLSGKNKNLDKAKTLLIELKNKNFKGLTALETCKSYVYLGYIEDLNNNRDPAIAYYKKALEIKSEGLTGIKKMAEYGITHPLKWLKHLDQNNSILKTMSKKEQLQNFEILWNAIDKNYSFFELKKINWNKIKTEYKKKIELCTNTNSFYEILDDLVRELKNAHANITNYKKDSYLDIYSPEFITRLIENRAVVVFVKENSEAYNKGIRIGSTIVEVDGKTIELKRESIRKLLNQNSSERAFKEEASRRIIHGEKDSKIKIKYIPYLSKKIKEITLTRNEIVPNIEYLQKNATLIKGKYLEYGLIDAKYGYIKIASFHGKNEIADEFNTALEFLKNTKGLIIDIRENRGGYGISHQEIIGRLISEEKKVSINYNKNGLAHNSFEKQELYYKPTGSWQYKKPIVLMFDSITGSASDLFAAKLISTKRVITIGQTTHGDLCGSMASIELPCKLIIDIPDSYITDANGRIIELNGNKPDINSELIISDLVKGKDTVLEKATEILKNKATK